MPINIEQLANLEPAKTILFFGAGSSIQSGAPSVQALVDRLGEKFGLAKDYSLPELASLIEEKYGRRELIDEVRLRISKARPTGSLLNIPLYSWRSLYTTNYDELLEQSYSRSDVPLSVYASNFDFTVHETPEATRLFKLHGTISQDVSLGHQSRLVISEGDYDLAADYREFLLQTFAADLAHAHLIILGYSLRDPHIKEIVDLALRTRKKLAQASSISILALPQNLWVD